MTGCYIKEFYSILRNNFIMKRILSILIVLLTVGVSSLAQTGLKIDKMFGGKYVSDPHVSEVVMNGSQQYLRKYHLNSLAIFTGPAETYASTLQRLVLADGAKATERDVRYRNGKLYYAYYVLPSIEVNGVKLKRYIYYLNKECRRNTNSSKKTSDNVMLIYFDGELNRRQADVFIRNSSK